MVNLIYDLLIYLYYRQSVINLKRERAAKIISSYNRFAEEMLSIGDFDRAEFWNYAAIKKYEEYEKTK